MKQPSPLVKPANQGGCLMFLSLTKGLVTRTTEEKADISSGERPRFVDALMATILHNLEELNALY